MSMQELSVIEKFINRAVCPEDVFGKLDGTTPEQQALLQKEFHNLAKAVHPDLHADDKVAGPLAELLFKALQEFRTVAQERIKDGIYGHRIPMPGREPIIVKG